MTPAIRCAALVKLLPRLGVPSTVTVSMAIWHAHQHTTHPLVNTGSTWEVTLLLALYVGYRLNTAGNTLLVVADNVASSSR